MSYTTPTLSLIGQASNVVLNIKSVPTHENIFGRGYQTGLAYHDPSAIGEW